MIDDRLDAHTALRGLVRHLYLFGPQGSAPPDRAQPTPTWADVEHAVTATNV